MGGHLEIFTVGHPTRTTLELIDVLQAHGVTHVVDVRSIPRSRRHPQFDQEALRAALRDAGIAYTHLAALGGRRPRSKDVDESVNAGWTVQAFHNFADYARSQAFRDGLRRLLRLGGKEACAIMCAEAVWWRCHRRIIADHLLADGVGVTHLLSRTTATPATLTPFAVVGPSGRVSYPARGANPEGKENQAPRGGLPRRPPAGRPMRSPQRAKAYVLRPTRRPSGSRK